jgi:hypothetical protein
MAKYKWYKHKELKQKVITPGGLHFIGAWAHRDMLPHTAELGDMALVENQTYVWMGESWYLFEEQIYA